LSTPDSFHQRVVAGQRLELVGRGDEGERVRLAISAANASPKPLGALRPGADGGAALRQPVEPRQHAFDPVEPVAICCA
jgi:hypothetical protein